VGQKLILISLLIASAIIPVWAARDPEAVRGLGKAVIATAAFNVLYLLAVSYLYWRVL
jgi:hypothetical protein